MSIDTADPKEEVNRLRAEPTTDRLLDALNRGYSVTVRTEFLDETYRLWLRTRDGVYYCDTPVVLHRHETEREMRACIEKYGLADATIETVERPNA